MSGAQPARVPTRFRRRLLWALLLGALIPVAAVGALSARVLADVLALSFAPVEGALDEADASLRDAGLQPSTSLAEARLLIAQAELARESLRRLTVEGFVGVVILAAAGASLAALLLGRAFARPIEALTAAMARVAAGDLEVQVAALPRTHADELAFAVEQFNRMTAQLVEQRGRLEVTQRLAAWQDVARAMAHDLKNPLTAMKMALARIARVDPSSGSPADRARLGESVALLEDQVGALMRMAQSFSEFARLPAAAPTEVPLRGLAGEVCRLYAEGRADVGVRLAPGDEVVARADPDLLRRALSNLVKNALEASPAGAGPVVLAVEALEGATARITVRDHGAGVSEALAMGRFVEGLSQKPGGSGLGLPITQKIAHQHGGSLALSPADGGGTLAVILLPGAVV